MVRPSERDPTPPTEQPERAPPPVPPPEEPETTPPATDPATPPPPDNPPPTNPFPKPGETTEVSDLERQEASVSGEYVLAVFPKASRADEAASEARAAGFPLTSVLSDEDFAEVVDPKGEKAGGLVELLKTSSQALSEEPNFLAQYQEAARSGRGVVAVHVESSEDVALVSDLLAQQGERTLRFFGKLAVVDLTPASNPTVASDSTSRSSWAHATQEWHG